MENASKALLIAGAILLVIALIAVAVAVLGRGSNITEILLDQLDDEEIIMHNKKFIVYDEEIFKGSEVKDCISQVMYNNTSKNIIEMEVEVKNKNGTNIVITPETGKTNMSVIENFYEYKGNVIFEDRIITKIEFEQQ